MQDIGGLIILLAALTTPISACIAVYTDQSRKWNWQDTKVQKVLSHIYMLNLVGIVAGAIMINL